MDIPQVLATYDSDYARDFEGRLIHPEPWRRKVSSEVSLLKKLLAERPGKWLDVACGTGYHLSRFPGTARAGLDASPAMLALARRANPDALFFQEGDFLAERPEWEGQWDLVTCLSWSYSYVDSLRAVNVLLGNLARWTSAQGACFMPVLDPEYLAPGLRIPYRHDKTMEPPGTLLITGVTCTLVEESGKRHDDMLMPQCEYMVAAFQDRFEQVDVVPYPFLPGPGQMLRAVVATKKRLK